MYDGKEYPGEVKKVSGCRSPGVCHAQDLPAALEMV